MKKALTSLLLFIMVTCAVLIVKVNEVERVHMVFNPRSAGSFSPYNAVNGRIRVGVEHIAVHRYFTIYSYVTGDQSHMEVMLLLEHLDKLTLQKAQPELTVIDNLGQAHSPYPYLELTDFPPDDPLGYKMTLWARFPTPDKAVTHIDIQMKYLGKTIEIKSVPIR